MIRVAKNRCGYTGYRCDGLPQVADKLLIAGMNCDTQRNRNPDSVGSFHKGDFDNYYNLPTNIRTFTQSVDHIWDMSAIDLPIAEQTCSTGAGTSGGVTGLFLDLYNRANYNAIVDAKGCGSYVKVALNLPCFNCGNAIYDPGMLEPMIDVDFAPVGVDVTSYADTLTDGVYITLAELTKWRLLIDDYINNMGDILAYEYSLLFDLILSINRIITDKPLQLTWDTSDLLICGDAAQPKFSVSGGVVYANNMPVCVSPLAGLTGSFSVYLNTTYATDTNGSYTNISATLSTELPAMELADAEDQGGGEGDDMPTCDYGSMKTPIHATQDGYSKTMSTYIGSVTQIPLTGQSGSKDDQCIFYSLDWDNLSGLGMADGNIVLPNFDMLEPPSNGLWSWDTDIDGHGGHGWKPVKTAPCVAPPAADADADAEQTS